MLRTAFVAICLIAFGVNSAEAARHRSTTKKIAALKERTAELSAEARRLRAKVASLSKPKPEPTLMQIMAKAPVIVTHPAGFADVDLHEHDRPPIFSPPEASPEPPPVSARIVYLGHVTHGCFPKRLVGVLEDTSIQFKTTVYVNSGFRSHSHNSRVGGARNSRHMHCDAADFYVKGVAYPALVSYLWRHKDVRGLGLYTRRFVHVDLRKQRVVWSQFPASQARTMLGAPATTHIARYGRRVKHYAARSRRAA